MSKISSSPERHTFQKEGYVRRCEEEGKEPNPDYIEMYESWREQDEANVADPEWQKNNMEYDLRSNKWICDKVKADDVYAQNLYAAMCNMQFVKNEVWPLIKDQRWSASWRHAGGIVADMREQGDYIDWYCSGIVQDGVDPGGTVPESTVTDEIRADLFQLGWIPKEWDNE